MKKIILILASLWWVSTTVQAQDDLLNLLSEGEKPTQYAFATFKTTRIITSHTVDIQPKGDLQFIVKHRFGAMNEGAKTLFGLDDASTRIGFEYGVFNNWSVGFGRTSFLRTFDFFSKVKLLRQSSGGKNMPFTAVLLTSVNMRTYPFAMNYDYRFEHKLTYIHQLLLARKFTSKTSLQIMPTFIHRNLVGQRTEKNDVLAMGIAFRQKLTNRFGVLAEYYYIADDYVQHHLYNPLSVGIEIETGGHVFQLVFSNSRGMNEPTYLLGTTDTWGDGGIHFGFAISRTFPLVKKTTPMKE